MIDYDLKTELLKKEEAALIKKRRPITVNLLIAQILVIGGVLYEAAETIHAALFSFREPDYTRCILILIAGIITVLLIELLKRRIMQKASAPVKEIAKAGGEDAYIENGYLIFKKDLPEIGPYELKININHIREISSENGTTTIRFIDPSGGKTTLSFLDYYQPTVAAMLAGSGIFTDIQKRGNDNGNRH